MRDKIKTNDLAAMLNDLASLLLGYDGTTTKAQQYK
jgi:hypothetical protein